MQSGAATPLPSGHLVGLYRNPPTNLIFFDECPGIQILKRLAPDLQTEVLHNYLTLNQQIAV